LTSSFSFRWELPSDPLWNGANPRGVQIVASSLGFCILRVDAKVVCWTFVGGAISQMGMLNPSDPTFPNIRFSELTSAGIWVCGLTVGTAPSLHCWQPDKTSSWPAQASFIKSVAPGFVAFGGVNDANEVCVVKPPTSTSTRLGNILCYGMDSNQVTNATPQQYSDVSAGTLTTSSGATVVCGWLNGLPSCFNGPPANVGPSFNWGPVLPNVGWLNTTANGGPYTNLQRVLGGNLMAITSSVTGLISTGSPIATAATIYPTVNKLPAQGTYRIGAYTAKPCPDGKFSLAAGHSTAMCSGACQNGYFASPSSTTSLCADNVCPPGSYCPVNTATPFLCAAGLFGSSPAEYTAACTGSCLAGYWCDVGSTSPLQAACNGKCDAHSDEGLQGWHTSTHFCSACCVGMVGGFYGATPGATNENCTAPCPPG
jgi:hypothetical protein